MINVVVLLWFVCVVIYNLRQDYAGFSFQFVYAMLIFLGPRVAPGYTNLCRYALRE